MDNSEWLLLQHVILNNKTFIVVMILYILVSADKRPLGQFVSQASLSVYFPLLGSTWYNFLLLTFLHDFFTFVAHQYLLVLPDLKFVHFENILFSSVLSLKGKMQSFLSIVVQLLAVSVSQSSLQYCLLFISAIPNNEMKPNILEDVCSWILLNWFPYPLLWHTTFSYVCHPSLCILQIKFLS